MKSILRTGSLLAMLFCSTALFATTGDDLIGQWYTEGNKSIVTIYKASDGTYAGYISWLKNSDATDFDGVTPLMGMELVEGFSFNGKKWTGGTIYNPEDGKTYFCKISMDGSNLDVKGSIDAAGLIGKTQTWTPAD